MKAKPTPQQLAWADAEMGVIIHYDITVFEQDYVFRKKWGYQPDAKKFAPTKLDTDQWISTAKKAGAKYAVLVTKHCTGFALFESKANDYNVGHSSYNGDIVREFVASCKKYDILPGVYYSVVCNARENVDNPGKVRSGGAQAQEKYNTLVKTQLEELWGNYGEMFEIWFDGGTLAVEDGGLDIAPILKKLQPNAVTFQGDRLHNENNLRWVGNEDGVASFDCFSTIDRESQADGTVVNKSLACGDRGGKFWKPAECDMPNRKWQWFYKDNEEKKVFPAKHLYDKYLKSVGRNCNLLLGMIIDDKGLVPGKDKGVFEEFGRKVSKLYDGVFATFSQNQKEQIHELGEIKLFNNIILKEDITNGHNVFGYEIEVRKNGKWKKVFSAQVIGHKRIVPLKKIKADAVRIKVRDYEEGFFIKEISLSHVDKK